MHYTIHLLFEQGHFRALHTLPFHVTEGQIIQAIFAVSEKKLQESQTLLADINRALDEIGEDESNDTYLIKMRRLHQKVVSEKW